MKKILVSGGAGFIGSHFADLALSLGHEVVVFDALTYAGHEVNLKGAIDSGKCKLVKGDLRNPSDLQSLFAAHRFDAVVNFAAESHVDRSITGPADFVTTNMVGTYQLLEQSLAQWNTMSPAEQKAYRYIQISTDEVYGTLGDTGKFTEETKYAPNSPYSASKAGGDHLARAWFHTYRLPTLITNCTNNYGPRQFPEKLIPHMIECALTDLPLPVYGTGKNVRDWIYVKDHCAGIYAALTRGTPGETYAFGGDCELTNLEVVRQICSILDEVKPRTDGNSYADQIQFVEDRKGHDWRYAIDDSKAQRELGYKRSVRNFADGLQQTVNWYLANQDWKKAVLRKGQSS